jgi:hypothetical protein
MDHEPSVGPPSGCRAGSQALSGVVLWERSRKTNEARLVRATRIAEDGKFISWSAFDGESQRGSADQERNQAHTQIMILVTGF